MTSILPKFAVFLLLAQTSLPVLKHAVAPVPPLDSPLAGVVVLNVEPAAMGEVQNITPLIGASPFVESSVAAVKNWQFMPVVNAGKQPPVSVTVVYRARLIYNSEPAIEFPELRLAPDRPPVPKVIAEPPYPVTSIAEGVVMLELRISPAGLIEDVKTIQDVPSLTDVARKAVQGWTFWPATSAGKATTGTAIVAISFLRPIVF